MQVFRSTFWAVIILICSNGVSNNSVVANKRGVLNLRKISGFATLDFFSGLHPEKTGFIL